MAPRLRKNPFHRSLKSPLAAGVALLAVAALTGCSGSTNGGSDGNTYTIGVLVPLTGVFGEDGPVVKKGVDQAITDLNHSGDLGDIKLKATFADNQAAPDVAVSAFNQMQSLKHPVGVITSFSGPSLAIAPMAERAHIPAVNIGGVTPDLADASPYLLNAVPLVDQQVRALMKYVAANTDIKRVALLNSNDSLGQGTNSVFGTAAKAAGIDYAGNVAFDAKSSDYRNSIAKIQALHPDLVYTTGSASQTGNIIKQASQIGFEPQWSGYSGFAHEETFTVGGKAAQGGLTTVPSTTDPATGKQYPAYSKFLKDAGTAEPDYLTETAYEATTLIGTAIAKAAKEGDVDSEAVYDEIRNLGSYPSLYGATVDDGKIVQPIAVEQIRGSKFVTKKIYDVKAVEALGGN